MGFFDLFKIKKNKNKERYESLRFKNVKLDLGDDESRKAYLTECLDQILQYSEESIELMKEYEKVTNILADMEELDRLEGPNKDQMDLLARKIVALENETTSYKKRKRLLDEVDYQKIDSMSDEVEEGIKKIKDEENYRELVKRDLKRIKAEKDAYQYRREETEKSLNNLKGIAAIIFGALIACIILLLILMGVLQFDIRIGAYLAVMIAAVSETAVFFKYENTVRELKIIRSSYARLITIQNTVKIRYVNNKNLLDYLYLKYKTKSGKELEELYKKYEIEKEDRTQFAENSSRIALYRQELSSLLNSFPLHSPLRWINREKALIDNGEMTELRHDANSRRQALRQQLDDNEAMARDAKAEIMDIATNFPEYAQEIYKLVEEYEKE